MSSNKELSLKQIMGFRKEKLDTLREMGVNPYPYSFDLKNNTLEILQNYNELKDSSVSLAGRIISIRKMGKASFFHIQDQYGKIQIYIKRDDVGVDQYSIFKILDIGDIVGVIG